MSNCESGSRLERLSRAALSVLHEIDVINRDLQTRTGLSCPSGCGACCENPHIETTVLEMLPAAFDLVRRGEAETFLEKESIVTGAGRCVFYEPDAGQPGRGRCGRYDVRPGICRLFGFATARTRRGRELAACRVHKATSAEAVARVALEIVEGRPVADFPAAAVKLAEIDPTLGTTTRPINEALREALLRVLMERDLATAERVVVALFPDRSGAPEDDEPPTTPNLPIAV